MAPWKKGKVFDLDDCKNHQREVKNVSIEHDLKIPDVENFTKIGRFKFDASFRMHTKLYTVHSI